MFIYFIKLKITKTIFYILAITLFNFFMNDFYLEHYGLYKKNIK